MAYSRTLNHFTSMQELATIWASSTSYVVNQLVINNNLLYRCLIAHTSSGSFLTDLNAGRWVEISASTSSGAKNYITTNPNFETNATTGWSLVSSTLDSTTKLPNQTSASWTAAAGTLSFTTVTGGNQLAGTYSGSLVSSAATTAGNMLISDAITLDLEARASVQTFSFFYNVASGAANVNMSGTSSNSFGVAIYDVTNAAWIQPAGVFNLVQNSGTAKCAGTFQVASNCTSVRLALYFPNASTGAVTLTVDDFVLGPQVVQYGAPVTDWVSFTPTGSWTNNTTYTGQYRRVGDELECEVLLALSGAPNAVSLTVNLPAGLSIDTAKLISTNANYSFLGNSRISDATGSGRILGDISYQSTTSVNVFHLISGSNAFSVVNATNPITFAASDRIVVSFRAPILGWSSTVQMSNDTDTRVVAAAYRGISSTSLTAGVAVSWVNRDYDTHAAMSGTTYTIPVSGIYRISYAGIYTNALCDWIVYVNGALTQYLGSSLSTFRSSATNSLSLRAGDLVTLRAGQTTTLADANSVYFSIERLSGPSAIAASETVAAAYWSSVNGTATTSTPINFDSREFDTHGAVTTGAAWKFTAPVQGLYLIGFMANTTVSVAAYYQLYKNGVVYKPMGYSGTADIGKGYATVRLNAGDYIDIRPSTSFPYAGGTLSSNGIANVFINRVGN